VPTDLIWRLSVDQYHAMIRVGILTDDDPVELLDGWLVSKMPKNPPHRVVTRLLRQALEGVGRCEVYSDPSGAVRRPDYRRQQDYGVSETLPVVIDGVAVGQIAVHDLLP
jgi:hypothetical protein